MKVIREKNAYGLYTDTGENVGSVEFVEKGDHILITRTWLNQDLKEKGLAAKLILKAVDNARKNNMKIKASCPYAKKYLHKHENELKDVLMKQEKA